MDINKDTIVTEIGGIKTNIKLGLLLEIFCELYDIDYVDEIIQEINDEEESFVDEYFVIAISWEDKNNLRCYCATNEGSEELTKVLEKVFEEEFYAFRQIFLECACRSKRSSFKNLHKKTVCEF